MEEGWDDKFLFVLVYTGYKRDTQGKAKKGSSLFSSAKGPS